MKKFFAVLMALVLVLSMGVTAFAEDGTTPTGTITITNAIDGETYTVYKMLDFAPTADDENKGIYTIADGWKAFFTTGAGKNYFTVAENDSVTELKKPDAELARAAVDYAKTVSGFSKSAVASKAEGAEKATVVIDELALGYYAVDTTLGAICSLTNTNSTENLIEKNEGPTLEKKIVEGNDLVDANNVAIGDTVEYQITVKVGKGLTDYVVKDTMSEGLTYNKDAKVYLDGAEVKTGFTVTETADGFEVAFDDAYIKTVAEKTLVIKFTAELNEKATVGSTGNPNTAKLEYKNESVVESTPDDTVITYTTKLTIDKIDGDTKQPLKGADFKLYKDGVEVGIKTVKDETKFEWKGLEEGTYVLKEETVPDGYNGVKDITIVITCKEPEKVDATTDTAVWDETKKEITLTNTNGTFEGAIENNTGALLPETGGIGTTIFYIVGITLMLGAAILLISKKKMAAKA